MGRQFRELSVERRVNADGGGGGERAQPSTGELMNSAVPFHLFSCVCSAKFLSAISAVVCRGTLGCLISAPRPRSPQLSTQERERGRQPRTITSPVTAATSLAIASLTEAVFHHISAVAQRQLACFSQ